eukprot:TRINITY_DN88050_c0_g1_i1.p1 TRINITY_DN88050_c0_g1~~TRINITY_DN88050_c0_g1_i1.p1  ORF type:complete len:555 (+),score=72.45 TRINITY_DN88050_c0_g1_i1:97-1665(+)
MGPDAGISPAFLAQAEAARRARSRKNMLGASILAVIFVIFAFVFSGFLEDSLRMIFRINQLLSVALTLLTYLLARASTTWQRYLDIPCFCICAHFISYMSMTYRRLQVLCSPAFDSVVIDEEYEPSEEIYCVLVSYLCVALVCFLHVVKVKVGCLIAMLAPTMWTIQVVTLGTSLADITQISVVYYLLCLVAFLGMKESRTILLNAQWEMYGLGNRKQQMAMCGIMTYLCDCVVNISNSWHLLEDSPKLAALLFQCNGAKSGSLLEDFLASAEDVERLRSGLRQGRVGVIPLTLKDSTGRHVHVHVYHSRYEDGQSKTCYALGIVENQEAARVEPPSIDGSTNVLESAAQLQGLVSASAIKSPASSESQDTSSEPRTLQIVTSVSAEPMSVTIDMEDMVIWDTSDSLREFLDLSLEESAPHVLQTIPGNRGYKARRIISEFAAAASPLCSISRRLGEMPLRMPRRDGADSPKSLIFQSESSCIKSLHFFDAANGETRLLAMVCFEGEKEILKHHEGSKPNRG